LANNLNDYKDFNMSIDSESISYKQFLNSIIAQFEDRAQEATSRPIPSRISLTKEKDGDIFTFEKKCESPMFSSSPKQICRFSPFEKKGLLSSPKATPLEMAGGLIMLRLHEDDKNLSFKQLLAILKDIENYVFAESIPKGITKYDKLTCFKEKGYLVISSLSSELKKKIEESLDALTKSSSTVALMDILGVLKVQFQAISPELEEILRSYACKTDYMQEWRQDKINTLRKSKASFDSLETNCTIPETITKCESMQNWVFNLPKDLSTECHDSFSMSALELNIMLYLEECNCYDHHPSMEIEETVNRLLKDLSALITLSISTPDMFCFGVENKKEWALNRSGISELNFPGPSPSVDIVMFSNEYKSLFHRSKMTNKSGTSLVKDPIPYNIGAERESKSIAILAYRSLIAFIGKLNIRFFKRAFRKFKKNGLKGETLQRLSPTVGFINSILLNVSLMSLDYNLYLKNLRVLQQVFSIYAQTLRLISERFINDRLGDLIATHSDFEVFILDFLQKEIKLFIDFHNEFLAKFIYDPVSYSLIDRLLFKKIR